jgi:hypothetical protein
VEHLGYQKVLEGFLEINGASQPKRAKTAFPLSKPHQAKTAARQAIIDERVKRNRAAAAERIQEGEKCTKGSTASHEENLLTLDDLVST